MPRAGAWAGIGSKRPDATAQEAPLRLAEPVAGRRMRHRRIEFSQPIAAQRRRRRIVGERRITRAQMQRQHAAVESGQTIRQPQHQPFGDQDIGIRGVRAVGEHRGLAGRYGLGERPQSGEQCGGVAGEERHVADHGQHRHRHRRERRIDIGQGLGERMARHAVLQPPQFLGPPAGLAVAHGLMLQGERSRMQFEQQAGPGRGRQPLRRRHEQVQHRLFRPGGTPLGGEGLQGIAGVHHRPCSRPRSISSSGASIRASARQRTGSSSSGR